jgi:hypothetical protein
MASQNAGARAARLNRYTARSTYRTGKPVPRLDVALTFRALPVAILAAALLFAPPVNGQSQGDVTSDLLHSDLPLFGRGADNEWPQHFEDEDSFGCTSRVAFGDWVFRTGAEVEDDTRWYRFSNYGVFHCWANTFRGAERARLDGADFHPSFFVFLGSTSVKGHDLELWTIQIGARPGSEYLMLSRVPGEGLIEEFNVLQTACPRANVRDAGSLDALLTRYCAVNSRLELVRLARRMAQLPPLGTLRRVPVDDQPTDDAHE